MDEDLRSLQLQGKISPDFSLSVRPLVFSKKLSVDSVYSFLSNDLKGRFILKSYRFLGNFGELKLLPLKSTNKISTHHPYGWNDGVMIPANGFQTVWNTGVYTKLGPLTLQLSPEFIFASNAKYEITPQFGSIPDGYYKKTFPGQSSARINTGPISAGISSENLWWGPGQFSSLMMSNNAPGFYHLTINTNKPVKTKIGNFEWQMIGGKLYDDTKNNFPVEIFSLRSFAQVNNYSFQYLHDWKYINAMIVSYAPSFFSNTTFGFTRQFSGMSKLVFDSNRNSTKLISTYLPLFSKLFKSKSVNDDSKGWNQLATVFMKIVFPKAKADLYWEYGWNDHSQNIRDFIMSPNHSSSYMIGATKNISIGEKKYLNIILESNQLEQSPDYIVRWAGSWYEHYQGTGYSNMNQILGSGSGFGSNTQVFSVSFNNGLDKIGLLFDRTQREPNTHAVRWDEMSVGVIGRKKIKSIILSTRISPIFSKNYGWIQGENRINFMGMLSASYYW
jgi:hypothetical protein